MGSRERRPPTIELNETRWGIENVLMCKIMMESTHLRAWLLGNDISALGVDSIAGLGIITPPDSFLPPLGFAPPDTLFKKPFIFYQ